MTNLEDGTPMSDDLTAFLTARLAEDEAAARTWLDRDRRPLREVEAKREILALIFQYEAKIDGEWGCGHRHADAIRLGKCPSTPPEKIDALRVAVSVYSDHPDYDQAWKP